MGKVPTVQETVGTGAHANRPLGGWHANRDANRPPGGWHANRDANRLLDGWHLQEEAMREKNALRPGCYYHIFARGNNREPVFAEERNYHYFLRLYARHVPPVADTLAYCLMGNHVHLLLRTKDTGTPEPSLALGRLLNTYARAFNRAYGRTGSLFQHPFGRIEVDSERYFAQLVVYIHRNPQKHSFVSDFRMWRFSSYQALLSEKPTGVCRDTVLAWFGGREGLSAAHLRPEEDLARYVGDDLF